MLITNANISNSIGIGTVRVITENNARGFSSGFSASSWGTITNSYHPDNLKIFVNDDVRLPHPSISIIPSEEINQAWLINVLGLSPDIWNLDDFDETGQLNIIFE